MKQCKQNERTYQDWCIDILLTIVKKCDALKLPLEGAGIKSVMKNIIANYASCHYCDSAKLRVKKCSYLNVWWSILNEKRWNAIFSKMVMSCKAREIISDIKKKGDFKGAKSKLHFEHITPGETIYKALIQLKAKDISKDAICNLLKHNKLVVLDKEHERGILDGKGMRFEEKDFTKLEKVFGSDYAINKEEWLNKPSKSYGSALLRISRLMNNDVTFCNFNRKTVSPKQWINYLESDFVIHNNQKGE